MPQRFTGLLGTTVDDHTGALLRTGGQAIQDDFTELFARPYGVGPMGPMGPQGIQGIPGPAGGASARRVPLSSWAGIDPAGLWDDHDRLAAALTYAATNDVTLDIDCQISVIIGYDYTKPFLIRDGTNVTCSGNGLVRIDNVTVPCFVFSHAKNCDWQMRVLYVGNGGPINAAIAPWSTAAANFNDVTMKNDLRTTFGNTFTVSGSCLFEGGYTDPCALFRIQGDCRNLVFHDMDISVPDGANAAHFIPVVFSVAQQWTQGTAVSNNNQTQTLANTVWPTAIKLRNSRIDGYCMGCVGPASMEIDNVDFVRYSDIQDVDGSNQGGAGTWFAPPHAIYLMEDLYGTVDPVRIVRNCYDHGIYVGNPIRRGWALSLKITCGANTVVDGYTTLRDDGIADILSSSGAVPMGVIRNFTGVMDSSIATVQANSTVGFRFPSATGYSRMVLENISLQNKDPSGATFPFSALPLASNKNCSMTGIKVFLENLTGTGWPCFSIAGDGMTLEGKIYLKRHDATQTSRGFFNQGVGLTNSKIDVEAYGFRLNTVKFAAAPGIGAVSQPLLANWPQPSGVYQVKFSDNEVRYATLTSAQTTCTWPVPLVTGATVDATAQQSLGNGQYAGLKQRIVEIGAGVNIGNRIRCLDVTNSQETIIENGCQTETWSPLWVGTPAAGVAFVDLPMATPPNMLIDRFAITNLSALGVTNGLTTSALGWSGAPAALIAAMAPAAGTNPQSPPGQIAGSDGKTLRLTANAGTYDGTGSVMVAIRCSMMFAPG